MSKPGRAYKMIYQPIRLKRRLVESGISQSVLMKGINKEGYKCSRPTLNLCINRGYFPSNAEKFKKAAESALEKLGCSSEGIWETEPEGRGVKKRGRPRNHKHRDSRYEENIGGEEKMNIIKDYLEDEAIAHFGLSDDPFFELNDHKEIWMSPQLKVAERKVYRAVKGRGIIAITGDYGMGKSTFLRHILSKLIEDKSVRIIMPDRPKREKFDEGLLIEGILRQYNIKSFPRSIGTRYELVKRMLTESMKMGEYTVLIFEESHDIREEFFIDLKRLWDSGQIFKLVALIVIGSGGKDGNNRAWGLRGMIEHNTFIREFAERCCLVDIGSLNGKMGEYLDYRFKKAGRSLKQVFTDAAIKVLSDKAGTPQQANNIAVKAMQNAYRDGKTQVQAEHVAEA